MNALGIPTGGLKAYIEGLAGAVLVNAADRAPSYLAGKLAPGANVTITQEDVGTPEVPDIILRISSTGDGGGTGQVDRIQEPDNAGNRVQVADTAGVVKTGGDAYEAGDVLIWNGEKIVGVFVADGAFRAYDSTGDRVYRVDAVNGLEFWGGTGSKVWGVDAEGVTAGLKLGFKEG